MQELFKIWVDRLREGSVQKISGSFSPSFLEIDEKDLQFKVPVEVSGKAYLAETHLVIQLNAKTEASVPCSICNEMMDVELKVENFYEAQAIEEIPGAVFDFSAPLRAALLLKLPQYFECREGNCPERTTLAPYLRSAPKAEEKNTNFPFADL
jgi:uncharacterized metal-binding protein YceD (DUF177 family)